MFTPEFVVAIAFFIFMGILGYFGVHSLILKALDARGEKVASELAEAKRLREEAQKLLKEYEAKRDRAEKEAGEIVSAATAQAAQLQAEAEAKLNEFVKRRTLQAEQKIAQAEAQATAEVRSTAADVAVKAAEHLLRGSAGAKSAESFITAGIAEAKAKLN
jgi:F-type H+-transporting ATPase subunit b